MLRAIEYTDTTSKEPAAKEIFSWLQTQVDYLGGRILEPSPAKPGWRVQVIFQDCGHDLPLPDGCRRVFCPSSFLHTLGV